MLLIFLYDLLNEVHTYSYTIFDNKVKLDLLRNDNDAAHTKQNGDLNTHIKQVINILAVSRIYFTNAEYTDFSMVKLLEPSGLNCGLNQCNNLLTVRTENRWVKKDTSSQEIFSPAKKQIVQSR